MASRGANRNARKDACGVTMPLRNPGFGEEGADFAGFSSLFDV